MCRAAPHAAPAHPQNELLAMQERLSRELGELEDTLRADEAQFADFEQNKEQGLKKYRELLH